MEAATVGAGPTSWVAAARAVVVTRSRVFWLVAGVTLGAALLRFVTLGVQAYHHDEIVTASRVLGGSFTEAMNVVGYSESAPPLYYALAWVWTQFTGVGEFGLRSLSAVAGIATVPVAFLAGRQLRGQRAGLLAATLVAVNPMLLWYAQEARAYALMVLLCTLSLLFCARAAQGGGRRDFVTWGVVSGLALGTHYFAVFPLLAEAAWLARRRRRASLPGLAIFAGFGLALLPLAYHQMSLAHAEWIGNISFGHRVWETAATFVNGETTDIVAGPDRPFLAVLPLLVMLAAAALILWRGSSAERRAAVLPAGAAAAAVGVPILLALVPGGKDFVIARNVIPALVPLLLVVAIGLTLPRFRRLGKGLAALLVAYWLGFSVWASVAPEMHRPAWDTVAADIGPPEAPRANVTWLLGEASLRHYLGTGGSQVVASERYGWMVGEINFISDEEVPPPPARLLPPGFQEVDRGPSGDLFIRRYERPGPALARLDIAKMQAVDLEFRSTGVLLDGVGPGEQ